MPLKLKKVFCSVRRTPSPTAIWPCFLISVSKMLLRNEDENEDFESFDRWNKRIVYCVLYTIRWTMHISWVECIWSGCHLVFNALHLVWHLNCVRCLWGGTRFDSCFRWHLKIWCISGGTWKLKPRRDFQWTPRLLRHSSRRFYIILLFKTTKNQH